MHSAVVRFSCYILEIVGLDVTTINHGTGSETVVLQSTYTGL